MTFLLHSVNTTETAKPLPGGGSTLTYFDTTLDFNDANVSVLAEGTQKVLQWFLVPALVGDFQVDEFTLRIWANSSTGASSNAQSTLDLYELNATSSLPVHSANLGSQSFAVTPALKAWNASLPTPHLFRAGSSIKIRLTANRGALQGVWFHYDTAQMNSRVSLTGPDSLDVTAIAALDSDRNATMRSDPDRANKTIYLQARVTDPLGGYDVRWVNVTPVSPFDTVLLDNVSMARASGTPVSYESVFEAEWNYTNQPTGEYAVRVWALDNNGHNHYYFFQQFEFAAYPDAANSTFFVGGLPVFVNLQAVDSVGGPLSGAPVVSRRGGFAIDEGTTDPDGMVDLTMTAGTFEFQVFWEGVQVGLRVEDVQSNVPALDPLVLVTQVYHPVFQAETAGGMALPGASLFFVHPNGTTLGPYRTNEDGRVVLPQVPLGTYAVSASWRGIAVFIGSANVTDNGVIAFIKPVYDLTVTASSSSGESLAGAFISVTDATGLVFDAGVTSVDGTLVLLLGGNLHRSISVHHHLHGLPVRFGHAHDVGRSHRLYLAHRDIGRFPAPLTSTFVFLLGLVYAGTLAALLGALWFVRRKGRNREHLGREGRP